MTVAEFIEYLKTQDQTLPVAYRRYSEQCLLDTDDIRVVVCTPARPDGWIQTRRSDMPAVPYLVLPGN